MTTEQFLANIEATCRSYAGMSGLPSLEQPLKPREASEFIGHCIATRQAFMIHGDPGIGKTEVVMQDADRAFAKAYGCIIQDSGDVIDPKGKYTASPGDVMKPNERPWFFDFRVSLHDSVDPAVHP